MKYRCSIYPNEDYWEVEEYTSQDAARAYLEWLYDNADGWEWMPKDYARPMQIRVENILTREGSLFNWDLDMEPVFYVTDVTP